MLPKFDNKIFKEHADYMILVNWIINLIESTGQNYIYWLLPFSHILMVLICLWDLLHVLMVAH